MSDKVFPLSQCILCNANIGVVPAGFRQLYSQKDLASVLLDWWECRACNGWFAYPGPTPEVIDQHWPTVDYQDPKREFEIGQGKKVVQKKILSKLSRWVEPGPLLDFGCNFGNFLSMAREDGWTPSGFEPNESVAEEARAKGFDVPGGWLLGKAGFQEGTFAAITANDSFCLVEAPYETLQVFERLLKPGGVLAMRLTNKRFVLGLIRAFLPCGAKRDARLSKVLQAQFHSISLSQLTQVLRSIGFDRIQISPRATTAPWGVLGGQTKVAYLLADLVYGLTLSRVNLSPGVLLIARKDSSP